MKFFNPNTELQESLENKCRPMIRSMINISVHTITWISRNRRMKPKGNDRVKLNLGSGLKVSAGWINIDGSLNALISSWPKIIQKVLYKMSGSRQNYSFQEYHAILKNHHFVCYNLAFGVPLVDNCADFIYCSHLLEHLTKQQGINLTREMYRVLREHGTARIVVPDLARAISLYCSGEKEEALKMFYSDQDGSNDFARHKYMYDFEILRSLLTDAGFTQVTHCQYRQGKTPDIDFLDSRPQSSLFVEAVKE